MRHEKRMGLICNTLVISNIRIGGGKFSHLTFLRYFLKNDAVLQALKFAKWLFLFLFFSLFGACNEADEPHFSALDTQKLHLCALVPMPGTPFSHTPNPHLGYPIFEIIFGGSKYL
jgi:hypothetical protein